MANLFRNWRPSMTDATVSDPDYSEAELQTVEPDEDAKKEEQSQVEFEESDAPAAESIALLRMNKNRIRTLRADIGRKINKLVRLYKAINADGRMTHSMRTILLEEGVVDSEIISDSAAEDAADAADVSDPSEIAEKGATEEELAKASLRAQHAALMAVYKKLRNI